LKDDSVFTWDWGTGLPPTATTYYNNGVSPDTYPSPGGTFPFTVTDSARHVFPMAGEFDVRLMIRDDDGGSSMIVLIVILG
jgi:hypothetical protein